MKKHHFDNKGKLPAHVAKKPKRKKQPMRKKSKAKTRKGRGLPKKNGTKKVKKCPHCGKSMSKCSCKGY